MSIPDTSAADPQNVASSSSTLPHSAVELAAGLNQAQSVFDTADPSQVAPTCPSATCCAHYHNNAFMQEAKIPASRGDRWRLPRDGPRLGSCPSEASTDDIKQARQGLVMRVLSVLCRWRSAAHFLVAIALIAAGLLFPAPTAAGPAPNTPAAPAAAPPAATAPAEAASDRMHDLSLQFVCNMACALAVALLGCGVAVFTDAWEAAVVPALQGWYRSPWWGNHNLQLALTDRTFARQLSWTCGMSGAIWSIWPLIDKAYAHLKHKVPDTNLLLHGADVLIHSGVKRSDATVSLICVDISLVLYGVIIIVVAFHQWQTAKQLSPRESCEPADQRATVTAVLLKTLFKVVGDQTGVASIEAAKACIRGGQPPAQGVAAGTVAPQHDPAVPLSAARSLLVAVSRLDTSGSVVRLYASMLCGTTDCGVPGLANLAASQLQCRQVDLRPFVLGPDLEAQVLQGHLGHLCMDPPVRQRLEELLRLSRPQRPPPDTEGGRQFSEDEIVTAMQWGVRDIQNCTHTHFSQREAVATQHAYQRACVYAFIIIIFLFLALGQPLAAAIAAGVAYKTNLPNASTVPNNTKLTALIRLCARVRVGSLVWLKDQLGWLVALSPEAIELWPLDRSLSPIVESLDKMSCTDLVDCTASGHVYYSASFELQCATENHANMLLENKVEVREAVERMHAAAARENGVFLRDGMHALRFISLDAPRLPAKPFSGVPPLMLTIEFAVNTEGLVASEHLHTRAQAALAKLEASLSLCSEEHFDGLRIKVARPIRAAREGCCEPVNAKCETAESAPVAEPAAAPQKPDRACCAGWTRDRGARTDLLQHVPKPKGG